MAELKGPRLPIAGVVSCRSFSCCWTLPSSGQAANSSQRGACCRRQGRGVVHQLAVPKTQGLSRNLAGKSDCDLQRPSAKNICRLVKLEFCADSRNGWYKVARYVLDPHNAVMLNFSHDMPAKADSHGRGPRNPRNSGASSMLHMHILGGESNGAFLEPRPV